LSEKERNFLKEICVAAFYADKQNIRFVAAVDGNGKLLAGEYNRRQFFKNIDNTVMIKSSIFYLHYLVPALRQQEARTDCSSLDITNNKNMFHLKLEELGKNVYLVVTALADKKDRYLCVFVESYPSSKILSYRQIISKISNTSWELL
jgi:hypothetical protein